jgi:hypothetical protein
LVGCAEEAGVVSNSSIFGDAIGNYDATLSAVLANAGYTSHNTASSKRNTVIDQRLVGN